MKKYKELINEYNEIYNRTDKRDAYEKMQERNEAYEAAGANIEERKALNAKYDAQDAEQENTKNYLKILKNNILYTMKEELTPQIITVVNSYTGKKLGEKTQEKLNSELKAINQEFNIHAGGKAFYITYKNNPTFSLELNFTTDKNNGYNYFRLTDAENKVNTITPDMLFSYDVSRYIENINEFCQNQKTSALKIADAYKQLSKTVSEYNQQYAYGGKLFETIHLQSNNIHYIK